MGKEQSKIKNKYLYDINKEDHYKKIIQNSNSNNSLTFTYQNKQTKIEDKIKINEIESIDLVKDCYTTGFKNSFLLFKSINNILYLIFVNKNQSIIVTYDLVKNYKINEIKNSHEKKITDFQYYLDDINKRELIMSISYEDNNIRLWDFKNWEVILNLKNINKKAQLFSACFLNDNNQIYIVSSSNGDIELLEPIKIFDLNGKKVKELDSNSKNHTHYLDRYYDDELNENFIIAGLFGSIKSFSFTKNKLYHEYKDNNLDRKSYYEKVLIVKRDMLIKVIAGGYKYIYIWNFHSGRLLKYINGSDNMAITTICLWKEYYIFAGDEGNNLKLIDLKEEKLIRDFKGHNNWIECIKIIDHPIYGECLISQGLCQDGIKLWKLKNIII